MKKNMLNRKINFGMWRREVMDALIQIDLDVVLKNKRYLYDEEIWDRMNEKACGQIRSCLTKAVKYLVKDEECVMSLWRTLEEKYLLKSLENRLHVMSQVYGFRMKPRVSMHDHVSRFEKLLADLKNLDEDIKDEVKAVILLYSLPEEYRHFVTTLIYGKSMIIFKDVCTALTNLEIQNNDKNSEGASSEALLKMFDGMIRELKEVRFVPALKKKLIYVDALEAKGYKVNIEGGTMKFTHGTMVILQGVRRYNLYYLKGGTTDEANVAEAHSDTTKLWHVRLGYAGEKSLQTLMRHKLLKGTKTYKLNFCEYCVVGKKIRVKFGTANHDTREILEYVHSDVWGPTKTASIGGSHYFVIFVDDFSRCVWVYTMRVKDEVLEIFVKWKKLVETQTGRKIKVLRYDNGNGVAERINRTLLEKVRCMLSNAGLDKKFWAEAVSYASYLINQMPSVAIGGKTLMEMWLGKHAQNYDSLRIFGCSAYYHVKDGKLDPRARKVIFVGFKGGVKGFKFWDLEDKMFVENKTTEVLQQVEFDTTPYVLVSCTSENDSTMEVTHRVEEEVISSDVPQNEETIDDVDNYDFIAIRRSRREIKKPGWLTKDMVVAYTLPVIDDYIPNTFSEALHSSESDQWKLTMEEEIKSLHQNQTWELVKLPKEKKAIGNKWVYAKKQGSLNQSTPRYKVRLVAKGFAQKEGIDYNEVFSPIVKHTSIHILLALVAKYELELAQLDVKTMFLHGDLEEEIYMTQLVVSKLLERRIMCRILGMEICRDKKKMSVWSTQKSYLKKVLERFARVPYASAVGSLMYAMVCTRLDISQAVSMDCGQQCVGYCDSDFAGDLDKRRSTMGYVFILEAEYMAVTEAVKEAIWLKGLLGDLGVIQETIAIFYDNQSAIFLAKNQTYHARTKHIDVKYHYVREIIEGGDVLLTKINTKDNPPDMLTKVISGIKFQHCLIPNFGYVGSHRDAAILGMMVRWFYQKSNEIVYPSLLLDLKARARNSRNPENYGAKIEECLVIIVKIGVLCSSESPSGRMQIIDVVAKLRAVRKIFLSIRG
ncbi:Integrase catalytic domain-containing protein [Citrus sinensis]|nr:Integrase catalytic domain-containing protein [Citrus sinensis]